MQLRTALLKVLKQPEQHAVLPQQTAAVAAAMNSSSSRLEQALSASNSSQQRSTRAQSAAQHQAPALKSNSSNAIVPQATISSSSRMCICPLLCQLSSKAWTHGWMEVMSAV
jgi:hypothetical protein